MIRKIVKIDEALCDGCGDCVPSCHEGALQIIDGKARLISDLFCDGLGACLGYCPTGAITIEEREAEPYNERKVMEYIVNGGSNVIKAHLEHLIEHDEMEYFQQAVEYLSEKGIVNPLAGERRVASNQRGGCPGSHQFSFEPTNGSDETGKRGSRLTQWPVQLHLISPYANYFQNSDLLLAADCCAFAYGDFHKDFMNGKSIAIACPKLDENQQIYLDKLVEMIKVSELRSITVTIMQVPCCSGLYQLAANAIETSGKNIPLRVVVIGVNGEVIKDVEV